jgi:hypothetical protein
MPTFFLCARSTIDAGGMGAFFLFLPTAVSLYVLLF